MKRVLVHDREMMDLAEMSALSTLPLANLAEAINKLLYSGFARFSASAFAPVPTAPASGDIEIPVSFGMQDGQFINITSTQRVHILSGTDGVDGWGDGKAASGSQSRITSVFLRYATADTDPAEKWFRDDTVSPPEEFKATVNTRVSDYFHILVVHGTNAASPTPPPDQPGYVRIANVTVPANAVTITAPNISTSPLPAPVRTLSALNQALATEIAAHANRTDNPHAVTATQVGAVPLTAVGSTIATLTGGKLSPAQVPTALALPGGFSSLTEMFNHLNNKIDSHIANKQNPHETTATQTQAVPTSAVGTTIATLSSGKLTASQVPDNLSPTGTVNLNNPTAKIVLPVRGS